MATFKEIHDAKNRLHIAVKVCSAHNAEAMAQLTKDVDLLALTAEAVLVASAPDRYEVREMDRHVGYQRGGSTHWLPLGSTPEQAQRICDVLNEDLARRDAKSLVSTG
jgi:hypothetical protein